MEPVLDLHRSVPHKPVTVAPQWDHPFLNIKNSGAILCKRELQEFCYDYYLRFLRFFRGRSEGDLRPGIAIELSTRMKHKLGVANLFDREIRLNMPYFSRDPSLLPYTLFHEMVHLWLYDCYIDPGHTARFYQKMREFETSGLPVDKEVHVHSRRVQEARWVLLCPSCENRWYVSETSARTLKMICGRCDDQGFGKVFPLVFQNPVPTHEDIRSLGAKEYFTKYAKAL